MKKFLSLFLPISIFTQLSLVAFAVPLTGAEYDLDIYQVYDDLETSYTVDTTDANDSGDDSDVLIPGGGGPYIYIGRTSGPFYELFADVETGDSFGMGITVEYYNDPVWTTLDINDSSILTSPGLNTTNWDSTDASGWGSTTVNEVNAYYIRITDGYAGAGVSQFSLGSDENGAGGGGGGGNAAPEFSTYVLIATMLIAFYFISKTKPRSGNTPA